MTARRDLQRLLDIFDDVLAGYCEACRMAPCVCVPDPMGRARAALDEHDPERTRGMRDRVRRRLGLGGDRV